MTGKPFECEWCGCRYEFPGELEGHLRFNHRPPLPPSDPTPLPPHLRRLPRLKPVERLDVLKVIQESKV